MDSIDNRKVVAISGYFQILHAGHIDYIRDAQKHGNYLIAIINSDEQAKLKSTPSVVNEADRAYIVANIKGVDEVFISIDKDGTVAKSLEFLKPHVFCNGGDRTANNSCSAESEVCKKLGIEEVFLGGVKRDSSSGILQRAAAAFSDRKKSPQQHNNNTPMSKKVIVTGATGQDGSYMIEYLLQNTDYTILAATRRTSQFIDSNLKESLKNPRVRVVNFDLLDPFSIETLVKEEKPDYFINFGAQTFVADSWKAPVLHMQTNTMGTLYILEAIRKHAPQCRGYFAGSSEMWGNVEYSPQDEKHPYKPRSPYGVSKVAGQLLVKVYRESYGLHVIQGILLNHESFRRQEYFVTRKITKGVGRIVNCIKKHEPFKPIELGNVDAKRDWSHAADFVDGVWKMLNQNQPKDYVLSSNETHSIREFVQKAFDAANIHGVWHGNGINEEYSIAQETLNGNIVKSSVLVKINPEFYRPAEVELLLGDSTLARKELGWNPKISFDELVREMVQYDIAHAK